MSFPPWHAVFRYTATWCGGYQLAESVQSAASPGKVTVKACNVESCCQDGVIPSAATVQRGTSPVRPVTVRLLELLMAHASSQMHR